jgi:Ca2+-binding RTX toxin-like protein
MAGIEPLEGRALLSVAPPLVTADVLAGTLQVVGTRLSDNIRVEPSASNANAVEVHSGTSFVAAFDSTAFTAIRIEGLNGHDTILVGAAITVPATILGGNGRDVITGGSGPDTLDGGNGPDTLTGGAGDDVLSGGNAKDSLDGGDGADTLRGGRGKDRVTGGPGTDTYDADRATEILDKATDETILPPVKK